MLTLTKEAATAAYAANGRIPYVLSLVNSGTTAITGLVLTDILTNCERVSDHCSNIGVCIIQIRNSAFEVHDYLTELKSDQSDQAPSFVKEFNQFHRKYRLEA